MTEPPVQSASLPPPPELPRLAGPTPSRVYALPGQVGAERAVHLVIESINGTWCFPMHPSTAGQVASQLRDAAVTQGWVPTPGGPNGLLVPTVDLRSLGDLRRRPDSP